MTATPPSARPLRPSEVRYIGQVYGGRKRNPVHHLGIGNYRQALCGASFRDAHEEYAYTPAVTCATCLRLDPGSH